MMSHERNLFFGFSNIDWEQARAMLHGWFEMLPDGVVLIDPQEHEYIIADCNAAYASMNGYATHELIGQTASSLLGADSYDQSVIAHDSQDVIPPGSSFLELVRRSGVLHSRIIHRRKDGTLFPIEFRASVISIAGREFILGLDRDVSSQEHFAKIQKSEEAMRAIFDASPAGIVLVDPTNEPYRIYECNLAYCRMNGYRDDELVGQPINILDCKPEAAYAAGLGLVDSDAHLVHNFPPDLKVGETFSNPTAWHKRKDGSIIAIEYSSTVVLIDGKKMLLGIDRDITQRRREEHLDADRNRVLELIATGAHLEQSLGCIEALVHRQMITTQCAFLVLHAPVFNAITPNSMLNAIPDSELFWRVTTDHARHYLDGVSLEDSALLRDFLWHRCALDLQSETQTPKKHRADVLLQAFPAARRLWLEPIVGNHGVLGTLLLWSNENHGGSDDEDRVLDQSARKVVDIALSMATIAIELHSMAQRLAFQAERDLLTGLPNRYLFEDRLSQALILSQRHQTRLALLFLDLDGFKDVNDSLGHGCGDCVLQEVATRLQHCVRASDTVARLGGDEFILILSDLQCAQDADQIAQKIIAALRQPFHVEGHETQITASIGIAIAPEDGEDLQQLMRSADSAMYHAKKSGKNRYQHHNDE